MARWTWELGQAEQPSPDEPSPPAVFYIDGHRQAVYSDVLVPRGKVGQARRENPGLSRTGRVARCPRASALGDQHLTIGVPQMLRCYEQAAAQTHMQRVVVDREGMAAEFLAQLKLEGRQVVTVLRRDQDEGEGSFAQVGQWHPWRYNRAGQLICEVASARFALPRPNPLDPPVEVAASPRLAQVAARRSSQ